MFVASEDRAAFRLTKGVPPGSRISIYRELFRGQAVGFDIDALDGELGYDVASRAVGSLRINRIASTPARVAWRGATDPAPTSVLRVRLNDAERQLLQDASDEMRTSVSDFVRRKVIEAAELQLMERRLVTIPAEEWDKIEAWAAAPARTAEALPRLAALVKAKPTWGR
jgi:uncharacterized protein (DUF1778 family)